MFWVFIILIPLTYYFYVRLSRGITRSAKCLVGKTALVTGGNSGMGYQVALNLASRGCKVIIADVADMEDSKRNIFKYTRNPNIITKKLNLASLSSVREFAQDIIKTEARLDILVNNAGICGSVTDKTEDGLDNMMQINYFGHFLLTHLLIGLLKKSAPSRIVFSSSIMVFFNSLSLHNLNDGFNKLRDTSNYANSKLALLIASNILAEKLKGTGVISNAVHPGVVVTTLIRIMYDTPGKMDVITKNLTKLYMRIFAKDAWEGSQTLVHAVISNKLENVTGQFLSDCKPFWQPAIAKDKTFCKEVWDASEKFVGALWNKEV